MNITDLCEAIAPLLLKNDLSKEVSMEVRVGDVAEGSDLHCSVGEVVVRGNCLVVVPGDDRVWKDETLATEVLSETLWPQKKEEE
jgi:hypothetical protein